MFKSISDCLSNINKNFSNSTNESAVTTTKPIKLHSSDLPLLKVIAWYQRKARNAKCYLKKWQWPEELLKFGGKAITYRPFKAKIAKLRALGLLVSSRENGNYNKEYTYKLTNKGFAVVDNPAAFLSARTKNSPSKYKKQPPELQKTAPPLSHDQNKIKHDDYVVSQLVKKDTELGIAYERIREIGYYPSAALEAIRKYDKHELLNAYCITKQKRPYNPGAYMTQILRRAHPGRI